MSPEFAHFILIMALLMALLQASAALAGGWRGEERLWQPISRQTARKAACLQFVFLLFSFSLLLRAFYEKDFSFLNVAQNASRHLPTMYRLSAAWGSHEGSMLLWTLFLSFWTVLGLRWQAEDNLNEARIRSRALGFLGLVSLGFIAFLVFTSSPFLRLDPPALDGRDLNPLLQDLGMIIHPPLLYMGYVGFAQAFAWSLSVLPEKTNSGLPMIQQHTRLAWGFLSLGILLGSFWAYYELGWGGWWFWDPTENASLMPWLTGTVLLHHLTLLKKNESYRRWSLFLAVLTFALALIGTFLVRSGVLSSVHAFAQDPQRGQFLLALISLLIIGSLVVFIRTTPQKNEVPAPLLFVSKEFFLLFAGLCLVVACASVMLGTLYPLILDVLGFAKISVGPPYFNQVFIPLMVPVFLLMGLSALLDEKACLPVSNFWKKTSVLFAGCTLLTPSLLWLFAGQDALHWQALLAMWLFLWVMGSLSLAYRRSSFAMMLAHGGLALGILGMGLLSTLEEGEDIVLKRGEEKNLYGYQWRLEAIRLLPETNYAAVQAKISMTKEGSLLATLYPEKRAYHSSGQVMTESAIHHQSSGDLYLALGESLGEESFHIRLFKKPYINLMWLGGLLMALSVLSHFFIRRSSKNTKVLP